MEQTGSRFKLLSVICREIKWNMHQAVLLLKFPDTPCTGDQAFKNVGTNCQKIPEIEVVVVHWSSVALHTNLLSSV